MHMVGNTTDAITLTSRISRNRCNIREQFRTNLLTKNRPSILRTEDDMDNKQGQRLGHSANYRSGLQPSIDYQTKHTWGFAPGWYSVAPLALTVVAASLISGCKSAPPPTPAPSTPVVVKSTYPPRPTVAPPPFRVFHTTDNSITLVTTDSATDDQIAAILWQLHDAARAHNFAALHFPQQLQQLIDKRDPMIWFHIYRGAKCASEKYTTGKLPCGPSYHAAGDYTLGSFSNKNRDDGVLLHGDDKQTELWNPDTDH